MVISVRFLLEGDDVGFNLPNRRFYRFLPPVFKSRELRSWWHHVGGTRNPNQLFHRRRDDSLFQGLSVDHVLSDLSYIGICPRLYGPSFDAWPGGEFWPCRRQLACRRYGRGGGGGGGARRARLCFSRR